MNKTKLSDELSKMTGVSDKDVLLVYLEIAAEKIINKCYPFRNDEKQVPERYLSTQLEIAAYLINKRGAEGEIIHKENGIDRTYESASVPDSMLKGVIPFGSSFSLNTR